MADALLVLNAGSSSIKFSVFLNGGEPALFIHGQVEELYTSARFEATDPAGTKIGKRQWNAPLGHDGAIEYLIGFVRSHCANNQLIAVGHRVVHGGAEFSAPAPVTPDLLRKLDLLISLAPLHQPHNIAPMRLIAERMPALQQVACFDTAFHHGQPQLAQAFALPPAITERGVRRYGFHGLSYEYIAGALPGYDAAAAAGRVIVAHLGNGASMCAMLTGRSVASTMGFTPIDGLPMGTRCGALDPGVVLYLMEELRMDARAVQRLLYEESGLLGVSGVSSDMRTLLASKEPRAALAIDLFTYRIGRELGSLAAALGGVDALVFTGGIGEHAAAVRDRVCRDAKWLGVELDAAANDTGAPRISTPASRVRAWAIPTNEELMIARHTRRLISGSVSQPLARNHNAAHRPCDGKEGFQ
jgi:acetate kinase